MKRYELTADKAFLLLARLSQQHNVGLYKIAEEIAATADISRRVLDDLR